jgi:hypothetical protein
MVRQRLPNKRLEPTRISVPPTNEVLTGGSIAALVSYSEI